MKWSDIPPQQAAADDIDCRQRPDLDPPINELGQVCPWPWESQQLRGVPMGQYHCRYCGGMVLAGEPHFDARNMRPGDRAEWGIVLPGETVGDHTWDGSRWTCGSCGNCSDLTDCLTPFACPCRSGTAA